MAAVALSHLSNLQTSGKLSILDLASSISENDNSTSSEKRASDASNFSDGATTPASLAADLVHYKELFSKLRFSYHEQVTKEKFIRAITADPPLFVDSADNSALEQVLAEEKATLKEQKAEVARLTNELEIKARLLSQRYETLMSQKSTLETLPSQIADLEAALQELRAEYPLPESNTPVYLTLSISETQKLIDEQRRANEELDEQIMMLKEREIPRTERELQKLEDDLQQTTAAKKNAVARAREARERKEGGGVDEVERRGRWCRAGEAVMLEIVG